MQSCSQAYTAYDTQQESPAVFSFNVTPCNKNKLV